MTLERWPLKATFRQGGDSIQVHLGDFPHVGSSHERLLACLGVLIRGVISRKRGETVLSCAGLSTRSICCGLHGAMAFFRKGVQSLGTRDVLEVLHSEGQCGALLSAIATQDPPASALHSSDSPLVGSSVAAPFTSGASRVAIDDFQPFKFVTWNIGGATLSRLAPNIRSSGLNAPTIFESIIM